jgi:2-keto-4-pentenoate hydratase
MTDIEQAATRLIAAARTRTPCKPIRDLLPDMDEAGAYAIQHLITGRALAEGRRLVGRKVGATSAAVQQQFGLDEPDYGMLFADMAVGDGLTVPRDRLIQPMAEAEIAFILERDFTEPQPTVADVLRSIAYVVPAIEILDSRIENFDITMVDTIADNSSVGMFVLGGPARRVDGLDFGRCAMVTSVNGKARSEGHGADCLGSPLNAVAWLARRMVEIGRPLMAGDIILSGSLGPVVKVAPGDEVEVTIEGLGAARVTFPAEP